MEVHSPAQLHVLAVLVLEGLLTGQQWHGAQLAPRRGQQAVVAAAAGPGQSHQRFDHVDVGAGDAQRRGVAAQVLQQLVGHRPHQLRNQKKAETNQQTLSTELQRINNSS